MSFKSLLSAILQDESITSLTKNIFPVSSPKARHNELAKYLPAIKWAVTSGQGFTSMSGPVSVGLQGIQLDIVSQDHSKALAIVEACKTLLNGYQAFPNIPMITWDEEDWLESEFPFHSILTFTAKYQA